MLYEEQPSVLQEELTRLLSEALVAAEHRKSLARDRAIRLNGPRKASEDYDYDRAGTLVSILKWGLKKTQEDPPANADEFVSGVLKVLQDPLEGMAYPFAFLEEIRFAYTKGSRDLREKLFQRTFEEAEQIRRPPKPPLPEGFLDRFEASFEAFVQDRKEKERAWSDPERQAEARALALSMKAKAAALGNFADLWKEIESQRTSAGARCSSLIRDRDPDGRYDHALEQEYEKASRWSGTVALVADFLQSLDHR